MPEVINDNTLLQLLPIYYKRLFPHYLLCKWLGYNEGIHIVTKLRYEKKYYLYRNLSSINSSNSSKRQLSQA